MRVCFENQTRQLDQSRLKDFEVLLSDSVFCDRDAQGHLSLREQLVSALTSCQQDLYRVECGRSESPRVVSASGRDIDGPEHGTGQLEQSVVVARRLQSPLLHGSG